jgi:hypothetical protein
MTVRFPKITLFHDDNYLVTKNSAGMVQPCVPLKKKVLILGIFSFKKRVIKTTLSSLVLSLSSD